MCLRTLANGKCVSKSTLFAAKFIGLLFVVVVLSIGATNLTTQPKRHACTQMSPKKVVLNNKHFPKSFKWWPKAEIFGYSCWDVLRVSLLWGSELMTMLTTQRQHALDVQIRDNIIYQMVSVAIVLQFGDDDDDHNNNSATTICR